ncbi:DUF1552 domain-containing protein [Sphingobium ummariense]|uniref:DUF1552 domain-containing protein n=1 Tax=Sphingobium ummariense RL-3 TaxID=1346791 RepID=T0IZ11_9SPHN|nr:DUF1552 domain-containing protein [Sphingobium ummariense]EQB29787.1 hypothetical protein M529_23700 [Sphingobium ummariense RL-3]
MRLIRNPLDRRTMLRGLGATMALPFLEAMMPSAKAADIAARPKRLQIFYSPNGMMMKDFVPSNTGAGFTLPSTLEPLAAHRERIAVVTGLGHPQAAAMGDRPAGHGRSCPAFITGVHVKQTEGTDIRCGVSMDQVFADHLGDATQLSSLELGIDQASLLGSCDIGYSCAYTNGISWRSPTVPLPVTANPRDVFERLFGDGETLDEKGRIAQLRRQTSILDFVMEDTARLSRDLGMADRAKLDEYLTATRDIEKRIQRAMTSPVTTGPGDMVQPAGIPDSFDAHVRLMIDLQVLAMQADITRIGSFMIGRELSNRTYPEIGVPDSHHMLSHHGNNPDKMEKLAKINRHHMGYFAYYLDRMQAVKDGEGSLLDRTLVLRGSAFGDPNDHDHMDLPVIVAGGLIKGGRHIAAEKGTTMSNLLLTGLHLLDVPVKAIGDSNAPFRALTDA